ncbi:MAG: carboxypeptidase regulatory-like domain-containing protein [Silvibacterium sp.]
MKVRAICIIANLLLTGAMGFEQYSAAQVNTASIHGTVTDSTGAVIPSADVTVLNTSTGVSSKTKSDAKGYFAAVSLQPGGPYTVTVSATGFSAFSSSGLMLNVNDDRSIDVKLQVGATAQTVQVQVSSVQVETSETQLKTDILASEVTQLPVLGRDASQLEKTAPGVMESSDRFGSFSANGAQTSQSDYLLDGADVNDGPLQDNGIAVNPDALQEVAIVTSTLNPEYSRNSGAIINETLKTGTNSFHGNAFEFYRDTFLNNGNYFSILRPPFHQNLYGGTLGGPVFKNRLFFFLDYQGFRNGTGTTQQTPVFSPAQLGGDFSADSNLVTGGFNSAGLSGNPIPFAIAGCAAGTPWNICPAIANGTIPIGAFNPLALKLTQTYVPAANRVVPSTNGTTSYLYNFNTADTGAGDQGVVRIDYHPTQRDLLWGSSIFQSVPTTETLPFGGSTLPGFAQVNAEHFKIFNGDWTHTFNGTTINELRGGYFRFNYAAVSPQTIVPPSSVGFNITPQAAEQGLPNITLNGYFTIGFSFEGPQPRKDSNLLGTDIFTKIIGDHSLKFGFVYEQFGVDNPYYANNNGVYNFFGSGSYSSGDPAIDYLMGVPTNYVQASGSFIDAISREYYAFAQDSWRVSPDLTMNYGISWDVETPWANHQYNGEGITCWQNSSATSKIYPNGAPGLLYPGDPGCTTYGAATVKWHHFGPRIGFAWSPSSGPSALIGEPGSHLFAVRGGFGIYYNRDQEEEALQNLSSPPYYFQSRGAADFGGSPAFQNPFADVADNGSEPNPFPYVRPAPGSQLNWPSYAEADMSNVSKDYGVPYSYNFNLNIQRQLAGSMVMQIGYVGSLGRKLPRISEGDPITPAGHAACVVDPECQASAATLHLSYPQYAAQPAIVPGSISSLAPNGIPWYLSVGNQVTNGASSYHSLQLSLSKRLTHGLYFTLAYTYSHALDDFSGYESATATGSPNSVGGFNGRTVNFIPGFENLNYGSSDFDARHRFVALYNYGIPILQNMKSNLIANEFLGGWHISGTTTFQTGFPVTISQTGSFASLWCDGFSYYGCPDTPSTSTYKVNTMNPRNPGHLWFNPSLFSPEPLGTFGNVGRNYFHGPGFNYTNLALYKDFPLGKESRYLELRLESYNVFNHANFAQPDGDFSDSTFGQILSVIQPVSFGNNGATDPQPGRATQLGAKIYF